MSVDIYNQRYETFRHLDKLRWQMLQLLIAIASATALVLRSTTGEIEWWFYFLLGASLMTLSFVMLRIGSGIRKNAVELKTAADAIGDHGMPDVSNEWKSIAHWIAVLVMGLGAFLVGTSASMANIFSGG
ncbi:hypothetical protein [Ruegeria arenilitoris]|uniref:hypothetical protein n=1 Tax=Ruegeria arenilitoris TaxID=1173585 RepID=UPI001C2BF236|nr:hypothetical protein [Ruegeria arenilitoris]